MLGKKTEPVSPASRSSWYCSYGMTSLVNHVENMINKGGNNLFSLEDIEPCIKGVHVHYVSMDPLDGWLNIFQTEIAIAPPCFATLSWENSRSARAARDRRNTCTVGVIDSDSHND
jgi:hypothetical protein